MHDLAFSLEVSGIHLWEKSALYNPEKNASPQNAKMSDLQPNFLLEILF